MTRFILRNIKRFYRLVYILSHIPWLKAFKLYSREEGIVVLIPGIFRNYFINSLELDIANLIALLNLNQKYKLSFGKSIHGFSNRYIVLNTTDSFNTIHDMGSVHGMYRVINELEKNGNVVYPNSYDVMYWENKVYMYQRFMDLGINHPKTTFYHSRQEILNTDLVFPCLLKEVHSHASLGVHLLKSKGDLITLLDAQDLLDRNRILIVQDLINIRKDLRVVLVANHIVSHYWRINLSSEWKPTSTSHGSDVDFVSFPEQWRDHIVKEFSKLKMITGAFDIAWQDDDLSTQPLFLEVSPSYQPNPPFNVRMKPYSYGQFKKRFSIFSSWDKLYINEILRIRALVMRHWLRRTD